VGRDLAVKVSQNGVQKNEVHEVGCCIVIG